MFIRCQVSLDFRDNILRILVYCLLVSFLLIVLLAASDLFSTDLNVIIEENIFRGLNMIDHFGLSVLEPNVIPPEFVLLDLPFSLFLLINGVCFRHCLDLLLSALIVVCYQLFIRCVAILLLRAVRAHLLCSYISLIVFATSQYRIGAAIFKIDFP